jgi:hypothetical protein
MEVQVAAHWRTSSYSGNGGGTCVEVGEAQRGVLVRDTQDRTGPMLRFAPAAWRRFAGQVKRSLASGPRCRAGRRDACKGALCVSGALFALRGCFLAGISDMCG